MSNATALRLVSHQDPQSQAAAFARHLQTLGIAPDSDEGLGLIEQHCEQHNLPFEDFAAEVEAALTEAMAVILAVADAEPYPCDFTPGYRRAVSLAWHFSQSNLDATFFFSGKVAEALGVERRTLSNYLRRMVAKGLARCVDHRYAPGKRSKIYRFIGPDPESK